MIPASDLWMLGLRPGPQIAYSLTWTQAQPNEPLKAFIAIAERLVQEESPHGVF
ncbi:MAG TPA: hypothetical protein VHN39_12215 [Phenylobacterium sp.]|nr:hypothetical protein [Phenylobacterium sp.]